MHHNTNRHAVREKLTPEQKSMIIQRVRSREPVVKIIADYPGLAPACVSIICLEAGYRRRRTLPPAGRASRSPYNKLPNLADRFKLNAQNLAMTEARLNELKSEREELRNELNQAIDAA